MGMIPRKHSTRQTELRRFRGIRGNSRRIDFGGHIPAGLDGERIGRFVLAFPAFIVCSLPLFLFALPLCICVSVLCDVIYL
jgi:hypothetical protein